MSRIIDRLPEPTTRKKMKVVVASASRTGTLGLYSAMKMLGYRPYHMVECVLEGGVPHMNILEQGILAEYDRFQGIKRYDRADFDKWLADYDCLCEIPSFLGSEAIDAYCQDPDVKFVFTERNPDKWVASVNGSVGHIVKSVRQFPMNILKYFDNEIFHFMKLNQVIYWRFSDGTEPFTPGNELALRRNYVEWVKFVKERVPPERICAIKLEDGLGWEQICPFLDKPIPDARYPRGNAADEFRERFEEFMKPKVMRAIAKLGALVVAVGGVGAWVAINHGPAVYASILKMASK